VTRAGTQLALPDFQHAFLASAALMALAVTGASRLPANAGAQLSKRG